MCKFQEADNWTVLSSDVDKVFESGDIKAVSLDVNHKLQTCVTVALSVHIHHKLITEGAEQNELLPYSQPSFY